MVTSRHAVKFLLAVSPRDPIHKCTGMETVEAASYRSFLAGGQIRDPQHEFDRAVAQSTAVARPAL